MWHHQRISVHKTHCSRDCDGMALKMPRTWCGFFLIEGARLKNCVIRQKSAPTKISQNFKTAQVDA
jgi:hypothetical protein